VEMHLAGRDGREHGGEAWPATAPPASRACLLRARVLREADSAAAAAGGVSRRGRGAVRLACVALTEALEGDVTGADEDGPVREAYRASHALWRSRAGRRWTAGPTRRRRRPR